MAWDALGNIFKQKDKEGTDTLKQNYGPGTAQSSVGSVATNPGDYSSFYGQGGSNGGPVRAGYVNFGTLYDLNKDKAAKQADAVQSKAAGAAANAQGALQNAKSQFNQQATWGTGRGPSQGNAQGRFADKAPVASTQTATTAAPAGGGGLVNQNHFDSLHDSTNHPQEIEPGGAIQLGSDFQNSIAADSNAQQQATNEKNAASGQNKAYSPYAALFGASSTGQGIQRDSSIMDPSTYTNQLSEMDLKSGAGQGYTGPESIKGMLGDDAYASLGNQLRKAEAGTQALTNEGGLANALGYGPGMSTGNSALDTGLTETAGRPEFAKLAQKYKGLSGLLGQANADSERAAAGGKTQSAAAAKQWQDMLDQYETEQAANQKPGQTGKVNDYKVDFRSSDDKDENGTSKLQSNANKITTGGYGYTASDVQDAVNDGALTEEEVGFLNADNTSDIPVFGGLFTAEGDAGRGNNSASIMADILEKLRRWKESKGKK